MQGGGGEGKFVYFFGVDYLELLADSENFLRFYICQKYHLSPMKIKERGRIYKQCCAGAQPIISF